MKKLILILAIALIASPALAALDVNLVRVGNDVEVRYTGADADNLPRAFALQITLSGNAQVSGVSGYKTGESVDPSKGGTKGYGIYPATIDINSSGVVEYDGNPLAAPGSPGAGDQVLPSKNVVLEFASLYYGDGNKPATSGTLCVLAIDPNGTTDPLITMVDEDTYRGGLVFEDGSLGEVDDSLVYTTLVPPGKATAPNPANAATGVSRAGVTLSWTAGTGTVTSRDVYFGTTNPPAFKGNQAGIGYPTGTMAQGALYYWRIDEKNTAGTTTGDVWSFRVEECYKTSSLSYAAWVTFGRPSCWCFQRQCRGDADGIKSGLYWVYTNDLNVLKAAYQKNDTTLQTIEVGGVKGICADFDHTKSGLYRVYTSDLNILKTYYQKGQTTVTICDVATVNFWMN
ncbi:MAG: hypothetical protein CVV39_06330 [Planctomycetes bacterium HGW-Planctomycetes-1]|nr:MAG: hypothetical protein CVV39_06330 [Planctomycetes bacterium HGW-Planctomycetes-1]